MKVEAVSPCYPGPLTNISQLFVGYRAYSVRLQKYVQVALLRWVRFPLGAVCHTPGGLSYVVHDYDFSWDSPIYQSVVFRNVFPSRDRIRSTDLEHWTVSHTECGHTWKLTSVRTSPLAKMYECVKCGALFTSNEKEG